MNKKDRRKQRKYIERKKTRKEKDNIEKWKEIQCSSNEGETIKEVSQRKKGKRNEEEKEENRISEINR